MGMIVCFMLQCVTFFWNRYEVPAVALGRVALHNNRYTAYNSNNDNSEDGSDRGRAPSTSPDRSALRYLENPTRGQAAAQYQPQPSIHYTYSQGAFSQGLISRASSEAIFHTSGDADDESESFMYFMGGEVVIRRGENRTNHSSSSGGESAPNELSQSVHSSIHSQMNQMNRNYESTSTLQSTVAHLGTIADEAAASGLQAIHDLTPRLSNLSQLETATENSTSGAPIFPVLDSGISTRRRHIHRSD